MSPAIERQRALFGFALSALARRKGRTLSLLAVYALIVAVLASAMLFSHALRREAVLVLAGTPEILVQNQLAGRHEPIPAGAVETIRAIRGVASVQGRLWGYLFDPGTGGNYTLMTPGQDPPARGEAVLGSGVADLRGSSEGEMFSFKGHDGHPVRLSVTGILDSDSALISADLILLSEDDFRAVSGLAEGRFTDIAVSVRNPKEIETVARKIGEALPGSRVILRAEMARTYAALFDWREGVLLTLMAGAVLAFVIFAWDKASGLPAEEKREIGILKAVGWDGTDIMRLKAMEGAAVSLSAFLIGYLAAYLHVFFFGAPLFEPVLKGWSVLYPDFRPTPFIDSVQVACLFFFTVFPYILATVVPVWRAAMTDPDEVMR